jgi:hypothetical protein
VVPLAGNCSVVTDELAELFAKAVAWKTFPLAPPLLPPPPHPSGQPEPAETFKVAWPPTLMPAMN